MSEKSTTASGPGSAHTTSSTTTPETEVAAMTIEPATSEQQAQQKGTEEQLETRVEELRTRLR
ncbi:MAG: hypothetical protein ACXWQ5_17710, partial [Ktedonobacterales bacterium]